MEFWYKTIGEAGDGKEFICQFGDTTATLTPINDGDNMWKAAVIGADQVTYDLFKAAMTATTGVTIITESDYDLLT